MWFHDAQFVSPGIRVPVFLLAEVLALHSSAGPPGVNQVDGLPPALSGRPMAATVSSTFGCKLSDISELDSL